MSQTTIVSLLNKRDGRVISSIVPMKNGKWLEIKKHYDFQSRKQTFESEEQWLQTRNPDGWYEIEKNKREPRLTREEKWDRNPISSSWKDTMYLLEVRDKYKIKFQSPRLKMNLDEDARIIKSSINALNVHLRMEYPEINLRYYENELERQQGRLADVEDRMKKIGDPTRFQEFYPLTKNMTLAYVQTNGQMLPISICEVDDVWKIVYETRSAARFMELGLPEHPNLWVKVRGNKFIQVC